MRPVPGAIDDHVHFRDPGYPHKEDFASGTVAAAFGGVNFIEFLPEDRVIVNPLRLASGIINEMQSSLIVCFSGQSRASHEIITDQIAHVKRKDNAPLDGMHQLKQDAFDMKTALLRGA